LPAVDPARTIPVLPTPDIGATRTFYCERLGFDAVGPGMNDYLIVRRNEMEINFWKSDDLKLPKSRPVTFAAARCPPCTPSSRCGASKG